MRQAFAAMLVFCAVTLSVSADRVRLKDGRVIEGKVRQVDGEVLIELNYGVVSYPASQVESIEHMPTPGEVVDWRLTQIDRNDPDAVLEVAEWAAENDLPKRSEEILRQVIRLDPDHLRARRLLGFIKAGQKWLTVPEAFQLADGKLAAGEYAELLSKLIPAISEAAKPGDRIRLKALEAGARLGSKQFPLAAAAYDELAKAAPLPDSVRYEAIAGILKAHPDGMYLVTEAGRLDLAGAGGPPVEDGPGSLADPAVLNSALRDKAKAAIDRAKALMTEGRKLEATDAAAADSKYVQAARILDRADGIVPRMARGFRIENARRRITIIKQAVDAQAKVFDQLKEKLGGLSPVAYEAHLNRMIRSLNLIRTDLDAILEIAGPFPRDLILEITDARIRHQRILALREIITQERDDLRRDGSR